MPVVITKTKPEAKAKPVSKVDPVPAELSDEDLADQYGTYRDRIDALKTDPVFAKFNLIEAELKKRLDPLEATSVAQIKGKHWLLEIGMCSKSPRSVIDPLAVMSMVGTEVFGKIAKVNVGDAEKYLTPEQLEGVVSQEAYTKNRKIATSYLG